MYTSHTENRFLFKKGEQPNFFISTSSIVDIDLNWWRIEVQQPDNDMFEDPVSGLGSVRPF